MLRKVQILAQLCDIAKFAGVLTLVLAFTLLRHTADVQGFLCAMGE